MIKKNFGPSPGTSRGKDPLPQSRIFFLFALLIASTAIANTFDEFKSSIAQGTKKSVLEIARNLDNPNECDERKHTPLTYLVFWQKPELVEGFVKIEGVDINFVCPDNNYGQCAEIVAIKSESSEFIKMLRSIKDH